MGLAAVRRSCQLPQGRSGRRQDAFILQTGHHIRLVRVGKVVQAAWIEKGGARGENHSAAGHLSGLLDVFRYDGAGRAHADQPLDIRAFGHIDGKCMGRCLGIAHARGRPMIQARCKSDAFGKLFETIAACRALVQVDVPGGAGQGNGEVAGVSLNAGDLCHGHQLDVQLPAAFGQVRRQCTQIAVVGRKRAVELGHEPADGKCPVYQNHVPSGFRQIQGRSYPTETAADHQYFVVGLKSVDVLHIYLYPVSVWEINEIGSPFDRFQANGRLKPGHVQNRRQTVFPSQCLDQNALCQVF